MPWRFLRFETIINHRFNWALLQLLRFKRRDTRQNVLSFTFAFVSYNTQDVFLLKLLARIRSWKPYLTFVCVYKGVLGSLQAGTSTCYPAISEPLKMTVQNNSSKEREHFNASCHTLAVISKCNCFILLT